MRAWIWASLEMLLGLRIVEIHLDRSSYRLSVSEKRLRNKVSQRIPSRSSHYRGKKKFSVGLGPCLRWHIHHWNLLALYTNESCKKNYGTNWTISMGSVMTHEASEAPLNLVSISILKIPGNNKIIDR
jgi:hypothetical protein